MSELMNSIELRLIQANLDLANLKEIKTTRIRDAYSTATSISTKDRLDLEAEIAKAEANKMQVTLELAKAKKDWRDGRRASQYSALVKILNDKGLGDLVSQASMIVDGKTCATVLYED